MHSYDELAQVATVLTVYGIETIRDYDAISYNVLKLQQYLPFTVLKLTSRQPVGALLLQVATVLTVYGIETHY